MLVIFILTYYLRFIPYISCKNQHRNLGPGSNMFDYHKHIVPSVGKYGESVPKSCHTCPKQPLFEHDNGKNNLWDTMAVL